MLPTVDVGKLPQRYLGIVETTIKKKVLSLCASELVDITTGSRTPPEKETVVRKRALAYRPTVDSATF